MWISAGQEQNVHLDTGPSGLTGYRVSFDVVVAVAVVVVVI